ncbi:uncharacterized protein BJ171DRAFT_514085 [Polychytrium aggregatum]|uniref:uncharacterized protein n=1 Tax=Polychytrium aggregatum TaxID=110093 RepID=UPI0022FDE8C8|nr:uncharacterized protein BJ171DRAFT_514085 [Polychytrium aggregatum]KAI9202450.1 hypothetical protein BJ171DRAFT_514085 [Polychytrium aggregatum]
MSRSLLVYGGSGALGRALVAHFRSLNYNVTSVDFRENEEADANVVISREDGAAELQVAGPRIASAVAASLGTMKVDAILNVAGGWAGGNILDEDLYKNVSLMLSQSVNSSVIASRIAAAHLKEGGLLTLVGAGAAVSGTPGNMIAYGLAKAAVHHLVKSLASNGSGLPEGARTVAILPVTLDTPMNRKFMPDADFSSWTPLSEIAERLQRWSENSDAVVSGSLVKIVTKDGKTEWINV